jgi:hypothetical protein
MSCSRPAIRSITALISARLATTGKRKPRRARGKSPKSPIGPPACATPACALHADWRGLRETPDGLRRPESPRLQGARSRRQTESEAPRSRAARVPVRPRRSGRHFDAPATGRTPGSWTRSREAQDFACLSRAAQYRLHAHARSCPSLWRVRHSEGEATVKGVSAQRHRAAMPTQSPGTVHSTGRGRRAPVAPAKRDGFLLRPRLPKHRNVSLGPPRLRVQRRHPRSSRLRHIIPPPLACYASKSHRKYGLSSGFLTNIIPRRGADGMLSLRHNTMLARTLRAAPTGPRLPIRGPVRLEEGWQVLVS